MGIVAFFKPFFHESFVVIFVSYLCLYAGCFVVADVSGVK